MDGGGRDVDLSTFSGFFPLGDNLLLIQYRDLFLDACRYCDILAPMYTRGDDYIIKRFLPKDVILVQLSSLDPFQYLRSFQGKKVLIVHPFKKSIEFQHKRLDKIWPADIYSEFDIICIKAVQSIAGEETEYKDWFEALAYMERQVDMVEFDIALIGCGAYGFPLAAYIKKMGKPVIHVGGCLQMMFGIKGKRWENNPIYQKFFNQYWIYPLRDEIPEKAHMVEKGCYWG